MCQVGDLRQNCTEEQWLEIPYLAGYQASCQGRIRNAKTGRVKTENRSWNGYFRIQVNINTYPKRGKKQYRVHRLVAATWLYDNIELEVDHKDGNKRNNAAYNLQYMTHAENMEKYYEPDSSDLSKSA